MDNLERKVEEVVQDSLAAKEDQAAQVQEVKPPNASNIYRTILT